jgi:hypothetical protein
MAVDYRKVNSKVVFDSYPMPTIEKANNLGMWGCFLRPKFRLLPNPPFFPESVSDSLLYAIRLLNTSYR